MIHVTIIVLRGNYRPIRLAYLMPMRFERRRTLLESVRSVLMLATDTLRRSQSSSPLAPAIKARLTRLKDPTAS